MSRRAQDQQNEAKIARVAESRELIVIGVQKGCTSNERGDPGCAQQTHQLVGRYFQPKMEEAIGLRE